MQAGSAWRSTALCAALCTGALLVTTPAQAQETFKLSIVSFLSGQAVASFGIQPCAKPAARRAKPVQPAQPERGGLTATHSGGGQIGR